MNATGEAGLSPAPAPADDVVTEDVVEAYSFSTGVTLFAHALTICCTLCAITSRAV